METEKHPTPPQQRFCSSDRGSRFALLAITAGVTLASMVAYEVTKQWLHPRIALWQSHAITIAFATLLSTSAAYFVSRRISESVQIMRLNRTLQAEREQILLHNEMTGFLQSCQTLDEAFLVIRQFAVRLFPGDAGCILMLSDSRNIAEAVVSWGNPALDHTRFSPDRCWALRRGQPYLSQGPSSALCQSLRGDGPFPRICIPLTAQGETFGVLYFENCQKCSSDENSSISKRELWIATGEQLSLTLGNIRLRNKLTNQSIRDPLTGLFNRRYMEESLERELQRAIRHEISLSILMIDLDHFKNLNDHLGHGRGDSLLQEIGECLIRTVRREDIPCRYGGDEFVIVLIDSSLDAAQQSAERLREALRSIRMGVARELTISVGVASYPEHGDTIDALLRAADAALYAAKKAGRDRVVVCECSSSGVH